MSVRVLLAAVAAAVGLAALAQVSAAGRGADGVPRFGHVFVIIGENTDYQHLTATNAPYLMTTVRPSSAWFENYNAATHWSQANYVALTSGQFTPCEQKDLGYACRDDVDNIFHQLDGARMSWKVWLEAGTAKCDTGSGGSCTSNDPCPLTGFYTTGNPPIDFTDISYDECLANDVPAGTPEDGMATFNTDLTTGNVGDFNVVIPNGCDDGEAQCKPVNNRYTQFDNYLAKEIPKIMSSPSFGSDGLIIVTYDESERQNGLDPKYGYGQGGHVATLFIGPQVQPGGYSGAFNHYGLLRTLEDGYRLNGYVGHANDVPAITPIWKL